MDEEQHRLAVVAAFCDAVRALRAAMEAGAIAPQGDYFEMRLADPETAPVALAVTWPMPPGRDDDDVSLWPPPPDYSESPPPPYSGRLWTLDEVTQIKKPPGK